MNDIRLAAPFLVSNDSKAPVKEHLIWRSVNDVLSDHRRNEGGLIFLSHILQKSAGTQLQQYPPGNAHRFTVTHPIVRADLGWSTYHHVETVLSQKQCPRHQGHAWTIPRNTAKDRSITAT